MKYLIKLIGEKEISINEDEAKILKQAVLSGNAPKYIEIENTVFATHQIVMIYPDDEIENYPRLNEAPKTPEQIEQRNKILDEMRKKLNL